MLNPQFGIFKEDLMVKDLEENKPLVRAKPNSYWNSNQIVMDLVPLVDFFVVVVCAIFSKIFYVDLVKGVTALNFSPVLVGIIGALLSFFIMTIRGHYQFTNLTSRKTALFRIVRSVSLAFLILVFIAYAMKISDLYSRGWFLIWFAMSVLTLWVVRILLVKLVNMLSMAGYFNKHVAIYGAGPNAIELQNAISDKLLNAELVGIFADENRVIHSDEKNPISGDLDELVNLGQMNAIDEVIICLPAGQKEQMMNAIGKLSVLPVELKIFPDQLDLGIIKPRAEVNGEFYLLNLHRRPLGDRAEIWKRMLDLTIGSALILMLAPLFLLIMIAVKLDSKGSIFYIQKRHGFNHKTINVLKFRTMNVEESGDNIRQATKDDDRITRVGKFLRRSSLDELLQLINVLKGEMSLVGPRPHALVQNEYYSQTIDNYAVRHKVKPGITGWAQVKGLRGETNTVEKMKARAEADIYYIENWTIWLDLKILFWTPFVIWFQKNAY